MKSWAWTLISPSPWSCRQAPLWTTWKGSTARGAHARQGSVSDVAWVTGSWVFNFFSYSYYEGFSMQDISFPIRALRRLGVQTLIGKVCWLCESEHSSLTLAQSQTLRGPWITSMLLGMSLSCKTYVILAERGHQINVDRSISIYPAFVVCTLCEGRMQTSLANVFLHFQTLMT